ncbi:hypothetical protein AB0M22_12640 [Nocardia sp. NPDC051756]|uniref:hypothetical protein n=1 Tax=Nocardia sp. NPDC051756 TaxID=3154751 RepID=UPI00341DB1E4
MTDNPSAAQSTPGPPSNYPGSMIVPLAALILSAGLFAITGFLTDWYTASAVFLSTTALFSNIRRDR